MPQRKQTRIFDLEVDGRDKVAAESYRVMSRFIRKYRHEIEDQAETAMRNLMMYGHAEVRTGD